MNPLRVQNLTLAFASRTVLADVSFELQQNQFVALLGANGAGKTTLLRAILGLVRPQRGSITVLGRASGTANGDIGYVPQMRSFSSTAGLCGRDFVASALHGERWGWPWLDRAAQRQIDWALEQVDARALAARALMELSGGERQRLLLAQALLGQPRLLLLDEPLISLDPRHQQQTIALVKKIQTQLGITVLFSAHEINPLLAVCDQVLYLGSAMAAVGSVDAVINAPVLSRLYGAPIEVLRHQGRIFVMASDGTDYHAEHTHHV